MADNIKPDATDVAGEDYDKKFNTVGKQLSKQEAEGAKTDEGDAKAGQDAKSTSAKSLKNREATGTVKRKKSHKKGGPAKDSSLAKRLLGGVKNKSAFVFVIIVVVVGILYSYVFAPNIILVNIKDLYSNDLADATTALAKYTTKMLDFKLGKSDCGEKDSIKCKLTTMSRNQKKTLERHGFTVMGEKLTEDNRDDNDPANDKPESRWKVSAVQFPKNAGTASDGQTFASLADKSDEIRARTYGAWNPKSSYFMDQRFKQVLKERYDLTKNATTFGTTEKEVDDSFDASMQGDDEKIDEAGGGAYSLKTLAGSGKSGLMATSEKISDKSYSYVQDQCAYYTIGKVAYNDAKRAKETTIARFAMQYLKAADQIKAGLSSEVTTNTLSGKLAWSSDNGYNGANATESSMYRHIVLREPLKNSAFGMKYFNDAFDSIGAFLPAWLELMLPGVGTASATKGVGGVQKGDLVMPPADLASQPREYCLEGWKQSHKSANKPGNCPALTIAGAPTALKGAVGSIAALSGWICPMPPQGCCWMMAPTSIMEVKVVMPYFANLFVASAGSWADGVSKDFTHDTKGLAASDAVFAGTGIILGDMAMSRGMQPVTDPATFKTYLAAKAQDDKKYEQYQRSLARAKPFDIYNRYSFMGSLVRSLGVPSSAKPDLASAATNFLTVLPSSVKSLEKTTNAIYNLQPDEFDPSRLRCPDAEYMQIGIHADVACNVRYMMNTQDMNADMKGVLDYMLKSHSDAYKDTLDDLNKRKGETDTGNDLQHMQDIGRQIDEVQGASGEPFIDKKTGAPTPHSEYEKFMDYCVNRQDPWGRTGMATRRTELSAEEKEKRRATKDENGNPVSENDNGSEYEKKIDSEYMAITEGSAADQDWYTGKKCLDQGEMLHNFRAYTMGCMVDGSFANSPDCTEADHEGFYGDDFYTSNDIFYLSWY